jgi:hypothetical protein
MVVALAPPERQRLSGAGAGRLQQFRFQLFHQEAVGSALVDQDCIELVVAGAALDQPRGVVLAPVAGIRPEVRAERLHAPGTARRRADRGERRDTAIQLRMAQCQRQRPVPAHGMSADATAPCIERERRQGDGGQLLGDVALHLEMRGPGLLRRIDVEGRTLAQVERRIVGYTFTARTGVRRHDGHSESGRGQVGPGLGGEVLFGAGQSRQPDQEWPGSGRVRQEERKPHRGVGGGAVMTTETERSASYPMLLQSRKTHVFSVEFLVNCASALYSDWPCGGTHPDSCA